VQKNEQLIGYGERERKRARVWWELTTADIATFLQSLILSFIMLAVVRKKKNGLHILWSLAVKSFTKKATNNSSAQFETPAIIDVR
jgi:hypothetical protein